MTVQYLCMYLILICILRVSRMFCGSPPSPNENSYSRCQILFHELSSTVHGIPPHMQLHIPVDTHIHIHTHTNKQTHVKTIFQSYYRVTEFYPLSLQKRNQRAGKMIQWLRALMALLEDLSSVPTTHIGSSQSPTAPTPPQTHTHIHIHIIKNKKNHKKK